MAERLLEAAGDHVEIVDEFGGLDPDIVEAAALAHDLGHPPFGHIAETELNALVSEGELDGYEGNAQTFRILTKLDVRFEDTLGLDLTRATLSAVSKYPWRREEEGKRSKKWGAYASENDEFAWSRAHLPKARRETQTLEARIMDWADDIAYAVHDLEDFYRAGLVPLDRLKSDPAERHRFLDASSNNPDAEEPVLSRLLLLAPVVGPYDGSKKSRARMKQFSSSLVDRYISGTTIASEASVSSGVKIVPELLLEVDLLKRVTRSYVIESDAVRSQRHGQRSIIRRLYEELLHDAQQRSKGSRLLPLFYRDFIDADRSGSNIIRCVADFVSSLTEPQVIAFHNRITGTSLGTDLDQVVY
jgi:dGTPase